MTSLRMVRKRGLSCRLCVTNEESHRFGGRRRLRSTTPLRSANLSAMLKRLGRGYSLRGAKERVDAVHDVDLQSLLRSLGLADDLADGELSCEFCRTPIHLDAVGAIFPNGRTISVVCDSARCMARLTAALNREPGELRPREG